MRCALGAIAGSIAGSIVALGACGGSDEKLPPPLDAAAIDAPAIDATVDAPASIDAPDAAITALPDLALDPSRMVGTTQLVDAYFNIGSCEEAEGCIGGPGSRRLLKFTTVATNLGAGDLDLGVPVDGPVFTYSTCHGHYHVNGFAEYQLRDASGVVIAGHKQAFCLTDSIQITPGAPTHGYTCGDQGISAGWADSYPFSLPCQWIDVTTIAPGAYTLRVTVNPQHVLPDSDPDNDTVDIPVVI